MIVWLTGGSSGLGLATARALRTAGHTVIAGARSFTGSMSSEGIHQLRLDVTDQLSVDDFVAGAMTIASGVDALVQCAGILVLGSCEETTAEEYRRVMDTDFLGMVRMNQAALPIMRGQGHGKIVMFSSINGLLGIPYQSAYVAAKHAVEGYAECLQMEARRFGVQVCLVEPGDHRGGSQRTRGQAEATKATSPYYRDWENATTVIRHDEKNGSDPDALGRRVARTLGKKRMPVRLRVASPSQHLAVLLHDALTPGLNGWILRSYYLNPSKAAGYREQEKVDAQAVKEKE